MFEFSSISCKFLWYFVKSVKVFIMAPKQRKAQRYNREKRQNTLAESKSLGLSLQNTQKADKFYDFAEEFIQGGRRTLEEIAIHEKM